MNKPLLVLYLLILCSLAGYGQNCTLNVNITSSAPNICSGNKVTLTTNLTGGTGPYTYLWNTGETTASIDVNRAGTFTVTVTDKTPGCQPVVANKLVTAVNTPNPPTVAGQRVCPGSTATLTATAPGGTYQWYDANGDFLYTGTTYTTNPITQSTVFYVETTIGGCTSFRSTVVVSVTGRPSVQANPVCSGGSVTLIASGADSYAWYSNSTGTGTPLSTSSTYATPLLTTTTPYYLVAVIGDCTSQPILVNARVIPPPSKPTITAINSVCAGSSVNLHADGDGVIEWYDVPSGGTPLISSPDYTTPVLNTTKTYYAQANVGDCVSPRAAIQVQVTPLPVAPASQSPSTCYGTSTTLIADANPTGSYAWFTTAVGGTAVSNSNSFVTPVLTSTTTYYVQHSNGDCTSDRTPVIVNITSQPSPPDAADVPPVCNGGQATLTATSTQTGGAIQWFTAASGGNPVFTGSPFVTPALTQAATYYVQYRDAGGCASERIPVSVTVLDAIAKPVVTTTPICAGTAATLKATGSPDDYQWYDQPTGGTLLIAGDTYVTPELTTTTTYYVQSIVNDCTSPRTAVTVTVNPMPVAPNVNGPTQVCPGESAVLNSPASGTVQWFNVATGGTPVFTGSSYTTPPLFNQTTFYVQVSNGSCESDRTPFTVSITSVINPQFQYPSGTVCTSGANVKPVIFNPAGGTFSSLPAGLVFVNNSTGEINVAASIPNNYTVIFTYGGACAGASSQKIAIVTTPDAHFTYNGPFCQSDNNPLPVFNAGASAGVFSSSSPKLVFKNTSTGEIDLDKSSAGTFQVTNIIAASAGCAASTYTTQVKISARVFVDAGPPQPILQGTTAQLAGSISGGVTTGKWTGGAGSFSDPTDPKAIYTPAAGETQVTLTLTSDSPVSPCGPVSKQVTITISPVPPEPTVDAKPVCAGSSATLIATAPGGTYRWYDAATGGNLLKTGAIFTTPPITADITYYVSVTKGGITGPRKAVLVTANLQPAPPDVTVPAQVCQGSAVTLVATGSTGIYKWYDLPVGGNLLKQGDTFTSGVLTISRTYYVETTVNGCTSDRKKVDVPVTPIAHVIGVGPNPVCSGTALNYTITADRTDATFSWSRAAVSGISNAAVTGQTTNTITETLINTTGNAINVDYVITPLNGACAGPPVTYTVIVNPTPAITNQTIPPVCNGSSTNYTPMFTTTGTSYNWSRAAVDGISNSAVSGQAAATIKEVLFNTTTAPIDVTYVFNYKTASCQAEPYPIKVTVNPEPQITSDASSPTAVCSNTPLGYTIKSNIPSATFIWSRPTVAGITNPAVSNQTDAVINEALVNTAPFGVRVTYTITPFAYGCAGKPFTYSVTIAPQIAKPDARSNSPVCEGQDIHLQTPALAGATFLWTGPNNFQSESQNPIIPKATIANQGEYKLYFKVGNCLSEPSPINVDVNPTPVVNAGNNEKYCKTIPFIQLDGSIPTGGTGVWTSSGTGNIAQVDNLKTTYTPSQADRDAGTVSLTLTSTGYCDPVKSSVTFTFGPSAGADAGPATINGVCNQNPMVPISGASVLPGTSPHWTSASGKGAFIPSADVLNPTFEPDPSDVATGSVKLTLTAVGVDECHTGTDDVTINFVPPPTVQADAAGDTRYVLKDHTITLNPVVSNENVTYLWTPATGLSDNTVKNPQVTGDADITYKLTITQTSNGCPNSSYVNVKVSPNISVKNTFTPNGDGANDYWEITGLVAYEDVTVDVFNRYGKQIFHSIGYPKPWDGTTNGGAVPSGTYYYVINSRQENLRLTGYVVVLK
ncbi:PKD-like domain-containing protein [Mucilaginibacter sp. CAU 1740]|uniref:Ig-like domain-containing protein n=1 Tax=Mucilaginibacter sp. CAU 1740 TaxID=3140365 RepID=UPI00325AAA70